MLALKSLYLPISSSLLAAMSLAQQPLPVQRIQAPLRPLGTYHVATGTWSRPGASYLNGSCAGVVYDNAGPAAYFTAVADDSLTPYQLTDNGRMPSVSDGGPANVYAIDEFHFA